MPTDHVAVALSRLPEQLKGKANAEAWLAALVRPFQDLDDAFQALRRMRRVDEATGVWLDRIGKLVVQPRDGITDDVVYRRYIRAKIATNRSRGTTRELITIGRLIVDNDGARIVVENQGAAAARVAVEDFVMAEDVANALIRFLQKAAAAGVRIVLETYEDAEEDSFAMAVATNMRLNALLGATSLAVDSTEGYPDSGSLDLDPNGPNEETVTYDGKSATVFQNVSATTHGHAVDEVVALAGAPGLGFGDSTDSDVGGTLADARDGEREAIDAPEGELAQTLGGLTVVAAGTVV